MLFLRKQLIELLIVVRLTMSLELVFFTLMLIMPLVTLRLIMVLLKCSTVEIPKIIKWSDYSLSLDKRYTSSKSASTLVSYSSWKVCNREHFNYKDMVKRIGHIHEDICTVKNIALADNQARVGKTGSRKFIEEHDENRKQEDLFLLASLINGTYKTSNYKNDIIYEPKKRIISKLPYYPDRIAHHAIMNILKPIWVSRMVSFTYANIQGRGIHACKKAVEKTLRKTKDSNETQYYLKLDIRKFYPNISHDILKSIINHKIKDKKVLDILYEIIDSFTYEGEDKYTKDVSGLPLGNYPSGYECNLYLTSLDRWIKEELKIKYVFRYADDILIFHPSKDYLHKVLICIKLYVKEVLHLEVKPNYCIAPVDKRPIDFIGYVFTHRYTKVRKRIKLRFKKVISEYTKGKISTIKVRRIIPSYYGWLSAGDCKRLLTACLNMTYGYKRNKIYNILSDLINKVEDNNQNNKVTIKHKRKVRRKRGIRNN